MKKNILILTTIVIFALFSFKSVFAQEATPTPASDTSSKQTELQNKINDLQSKISDLQGQKKTLSSQIQVMDNQVNLTQLKIQSTQAQISELSLDIDTADKKIGKLEGSLDKLSEVLINRIKETYVVGRSSQFQILLSSNDVEDFVKRANYLRIAQAHDKKLIYDTVQARNDYETQKEIFQDQKSRTEILQNELESYTAQLNLEKADKQRFLELTENDEVKYQQELERARAEYAAIAGIISGAGTETEIRRVNQGDVIATVISGTSCNSNGTHLHFTVRKDGAAQNPFSYLKSVDAVNDSGGDSFNPSGDWDWPLDPTIRLTQGYGDTWFVRAFGYYPTHNGIDIVSSSSSSVKAVKSGILYRGSYSGYGGCALPYVRVQHDDGIDSLYLHVYQN